MTDPAAVLDGINLMWPEIASRIGFAPTDHTAQILRVRINEAQPRVVALMQGNGAPHLVLKQNLGPTHINHFRNIVAAHRAAYTAFEGRSDLRVPALLFADEDRQITVMEHAAGQTAHDALEQAAPAKERAQILRNCGTWISHLHRATYTRDNQINPNAMQKFATAQRDRVKDGVLKVAEKPAFIRCSDIAIARAETARGKITNLAATHGDMNLRNLIVGPRGTWGIDFGAVHNAPIGHDLARFFINFANFHFPQTDDDPHWLDRDMDSFFAGYGPTMRNDPGFDYLLRMQTLKDWASIPASPLKRNSLRQRRWQGIKILRGLLFAGTA